MDRLSTLNTDDLRKPSDSHPEMWKPWEAKESLAAQCFALQAFTAAATPSVSWKSRPPGSPQNSPQPRSALSF